MPITTTIEGRPIAQFPDGTSPDVIQRVMKGIAAQIQGIRRDTMTGQVVQPTPNPTLQEGQRNPQDPVGMMEGMIVPKSNTPSKPFRPIRNVLAAGAEGVNLGMAGAASGLNTMYNYLNEKLEMGARPDFFKKAVEEYSKNAEYWENVAQKGGISKALHFLGKAIGEAPAGIADFVAGVGPAAVKGAAKAKEKGENELIGAGKGAAERFLMGKVLHAANQMKTLPRAGASAGVFAGQTAAQGGTPEQIGEAAVTGAIYGLPGKGRVGIKELKKNAVQMNRELGETGSITFERAGKKHGEFFAKEGEAYEMVYGEGKHVYHVDDAGESKLYRSEKGTRSSLEFVYKNVKPEDTHPILEKYGIKNWGEFFQGDKITEFDENPTDQYSASHFITQTAARDILKKQGYSGAVWTDEDALNQVQYQIWDKDIIKPGPAPKYDVDPALTQDTAARMKKQYAEDKQETPLWLDKGFLPAVKVDGKVHLTGTGHKYMADIPGIPEAKELEMGWVNVKTGMFSDRKGTDWDAEEPKPGLVPAVRQGKMVVKGGVGDTHPDVMKAHNIGPEAEHERGFMGPDGKFMTRARAKQWMKKNNPELYEEWVKTVEEGGEGKSKELHSQDLNKAQGLPKEKKDITLGTGLGGAQDTILKGLDRWLSPTKEHLKKQGEGKMPAEEWIKRVEAWGSKNPHIKDENQWNGLKAWLESKKGEKGGIKKDDIMEMLELSKGKWAVREQVKGDKTYDKFKIVEKDINNESFGKFWVVSENGDESFAKNFDTKEQAERWLKKNEGKPQIVPGESDPWADRNVPGGIPGTAKVWTLSLPISEKTQGDIENLRELKDKVTTLINYRSQMEKIHNYAVANEQSSKISMMQNEIGAIESRFKGEGINEAYRSPHFPDKPNVVVHFRTQEIKDSTGEKGLLIETIQSDWHQGGSGGKAPFEKSWAEVGLKHALDIAAQDKSIKWVGWSSGKVQNERWGKDRRGADRYEIVQEDDGYMFYDNVEEEFVYAGPYKTWEEAMKVWEDDPVVTKGMRNPTFLETLYDKRLPKFAKKYAEKLGGKYKDDVLAPQTDNWDEKRTGSREEDYPIHRIDLTTPLRTHINTKGQEFYQMGGPVVGAAVKAVIGDDDEERRKRNPAKEAFERRKRRLQ